MLALEGLEKRFGALAALAGIDLEVAAGEVLGIIGPNGSGKTTLLNAVTGVYAAERRAHLLSGHGHHRMEGAPHCTSRDRAHIPECSPVWDHDGVPERAGRAARPTGPVACRRQERRVRAGRGRAPGGTRRSCEPSAPAGAPASRGRPSARRRCASGAARRTRGRMTPAETAEMARLIREVVAPGRTCVVIEHKMALISVCLQPPLRARFRCQDRGRKPGRGARQSDGEGGLPGNGR